MSLSWWNVYQVTVDGTARTNNAVEGLHSQFSTMVGASHPTVFRLIEHLKTVQGKTEFVIENTLAHGTSNGSRRAYRDRDARLETLMASYSQRLILEFLRAVAHNTSF